MGGVKICFSALNTKISKLIFKAQRIAGADSARYPGPCGVQTQLQPYNCHLQSTHDLQPYVASSIYENVTERFPH